MSFEFLHDVQELVVHFGSVAKLILDFLKVSQRILDLWGMKSKKTNVK